MNKIEQADMLYSFSKCIYIIFNQNYHEVEKIIFIMNRELLYRQKTKSRGKVLWTETTNGDISQGSALSHGFYK